jgi:hypothetical protein
MMMMNLTKPQFRFLQAQTLTTVSKVMTTEKDQSNFTPNLPINMKVISTLEFLILGSTISNKIVSM